MLNHFNGPHRGLFANDDLAAEVNGMLLYVILPLVAAILVVRLIIYIWMRWRGSKWPNASPAAVSTMIGMLLLPMAVSVELLGHGVRSFADAMRVFLLIVMLAFPILAIVGLLLPVYGVRAVHGESLSSLSVYTLCVGSLIVDYFWLLQWFADRS